MTTSRNYWFALLCAWLSTAMVFGVLYNAARGVALEYHVNTLVLWNIFGEPDDIDGFRNVVLPKLIVFTLLSIPSTLATVLVYEATAYRCYRCTWTRIAVTTTIILIFLIVGKLLSSIEPTKQVQESVGALAYFIYWIMLVSGLSWCLHCLFVRRAGESPRK